MADVSVTWDDAAIRTACEAPDGPVDRAMTRLADMILLRMKFLAPVYSGPPRIGPTPGHPRQVARRSGTLRSSIRKERQPDGDFLIGPDDTVGPPWGAPQFLGPLLERGTPPHEIRSHGKWSLFSTATGRAYGRAVMHPGTRPQPFIAPAADSVDGVTIHID